MTPEQVFTGFGFVQGQVVFFPPPSLILYREQRIEWPYAVKVLPSAYRMPSLRTDGKKESDSFRVWKKLRLNNPYVVEGRIMPSEEVALSILTPFSYLSEVDVFFSVYINLI